MAKFGHKLPAVLVPDDDICVEVAIPNHPDYIALFLRAVRMLETQRMYERDETMEGAKIVAEQWRNRTVTPLIETVAQGMPCADERSECLSYPAYAGFIKYFPDNPFDNDATPPAGYLLPAWWRWGKVETILPDYIDDFVNHQIEQFTQYKNNDAICWISSLLSINWLAWLETGYAYPAIEIEVTGSGTANITLLSFPLGGRAIIEVDQQPNALDILSGGVFDPDSFIVDTARDLTSFPPEEYPINVIPIEITEPGDHTIYVLFLPVVNPGISDELIGFGGGLRSVELCGGLRPRNTPEPEPPPPLEGITELIPVFKFTAECGLEVRLIDQNGDIYEDYKPVQGWLENAAKCFGGDMATKQDIKEALIEWTQDTALKIALGEITPFSVDADGVVSAGEAGGDAGLPEDDPDTTYNDTKAAKYGAAVAVAEGIESVWDKIDSLYGATNGTPAVSEVDAVYLMQQTFLCDSGIMAAAVGSYYTYRQGNARLTYDPPAAFAQYLYCKGISKQVATRYITEQSGFALSKIVQLNNFITALNDEFIGYYYGIGSQAPSTAFAEASCEPSPTETLIVPSLGPAVSSQTIWKANHRLKITVSGYFEDSATPQNTRDFWWNRTSAGVLTFQSGNSIQQGSPAPTKPTSNQVPYRADHTYTFTLDTNSAGTLQLGNGSAGMTAPITTPTGGFTFVIEDLGEYIG
jgi:hypothetical protein